MSGHKRGKCSVCCPNGGAIFSKGFDLDLGSIWICNNCGNKKAIRKQSQPMKANERQQRIIDQVLRTFGDGIVTELNDVFK